MSYNVFNFISRCKIGSTAAKCLLLIMADHADEGGRCWPSIDYLADRTEMSPRTVQRHIRSLEQAGWIQLDTRPGRSTQYRLRVPDAQPCVSAEPPTAPAAPLTTIPTGGDTGAGRGDTGVRGGVTTVSPGSTREPPMRTNKGGETKTKTAPPPDGLPELKQLTEAGAQFVAMDRAAWDGLIQAHGISTVVAQVRLIVMEGRVARSRSVAEALQPPKAKDAAEDEKPIGGRIRGWLLTQTGLGRTYLTNEQIEILAKKWGLEVMRDLATEAKKKCDNILTADFAKIYLTGRPSEYGGWDYYEPRPKLPQPLSTEEIRQSLAA